jgi:hypothetical protein
MSERAMTFTEYVGFYQLARSEGLVLRYLADAYKALRQTVPESARTEELTDLTEWLGELVRQVDSSLLDEWERLTAVEQADVAQHHVRDEKPPAVTSNARAFRVLVRNAMFRRVELAALRRYADLGELDGDAGWDADAWAEAMAGYWADHSELMTGPDARGPALLIVTEEEGRCARSSTTRPATTTGGSRPPSTWPPRTRPARPWWSSPRSTGWTDLQHPPLVAPGLPGLAG